MTDFHADLSLIKDLIHGRTRKLCQGVSRVLYNEMETGDKYSPGTPVGNPKLWKNPPPPGYVGGFHRAQWSAALNEWPAGGDDNDRFFPQEPVTHRIRATIDSMIPGDLFIAINDGPAIRRLEFAQWSTQAPDGFVRPAVEAVQQITDDVVAHIIGDESR